MKKISSIAKVLILLVIIPLYGIIAYIGFSFSKDTINKGILGFLAIICAVSILLNIINSIVYLIKGKEDIELKFIKTSLISKVLLMPFYIINFLFWLCVTMGFLVIPGFQIFIVVTLFIALITYMILLSTSCYSIVAISKLYRKGKISLSSAIVNIIFQFMFVFDIISLTIFYFKNRKSIR